MPDHRDEEPAQAPGDITRGTEARQDPTPARDASQAFAERQSFADPSYKGQGHAGGGIRPIATTDEAELQRASEEE